VRFEPTRGDRIGLASRRLNHSAKVSSDCGANPLSMSLAGLASRHHPPWKISHRAAGVPPRDGTTPSAPSPHTAPQRSPTRMAHSVRRGQNLLNSKPHQQFWCYCISSNDPRRRPSQLLHRASMRRAKPAHATAPWREAPRREFPAGHPIGGPGGGRPGGVAEAEHALPGSRGNETGDGPQPVGGSMPQRLSCAACHGNS
jgi:hypothetical protein